ncbi:MAG: hypothetical protein EON60_02220 [Alphaproteobacteria bacterium]|nr:MAG: hypothetical protein EON60_02220 [Alphaproteobacteria bacterium]
MKLKPLAIICVSLLFAAANAHAEGPSNMGTKPALKQSTMPPSIPGIPKTLNQTPVPKGLLKQGPASLLDLNNQNLCPIEIPLGEIAANIKDPPCGSFSLSCHTSPRTQGAEIICIQPLPSLL